MVLTWAATTAPCVYSCPALRVVRAAVCPYPWHGNSSQERVNEDALAGFLAAKHKGKYAMWHLWYAHAGVWSHPLASAPLERASQARCGHGAPPTRLMRLMHRGPCASCDSHTTRDYEADQFDDQVVEFEFPTTPGIPPAYDTPTVELMWQVCYSVKVRNVSRRVRRAPRAGWHLTWRGRPVASAVLVGLGR